MPVASRAAAQQPDPLAWASQAGRVVGAAADCHEISRLEIKSVSEKVADFVKAMVGPDAFAATMQNFNTGFGDGTGKLPQDRLDCETTKRQLADLERAASRPNSTPPDTALTTGTAAQAPRPEAQKIAQAQKAAPAPSPFEPSNPAPAPNQQNSTPFTAPRLQAAPGATGSSAPSAGGSPAASAAFAPADEIRFGMAGPFSGPSKELGAQMKLGIETAFDVVNDSGGINGRKLRLVTGDDGYEPTRTLDVVKQLREKSQVMGFIGNVGTPTAAAALPYVLENKLLFFGAFTGASLLRRDPPDRYVFNYRASYAEETDAVVRYLVNVKRLRTDQIVVFAQQDAFGDAGFAGVEKAVRALGDKSQHAVLRLNYPRNTVDVTSAVNEFNRHRGSIKAVVMVAAYRAAAKFIEKTRDQNPSLIYTNVSFVGSTALADELMLLGPKYANGVIVTQVVPAVDSYSSAVLDYRNALAKYFPSEKTDYVSLEGYIDGEILIDALKRAGPQPDAEKLVAAFEDIRNLDLGLGVPISFSRSDHQGSHKVWGTQLDAKGKYQAVDLQ